FRWGAATAAHQVEGNNLNNDNWVLEHVKPTLFAEPSGDACDHYHRYADDIKLLARLGFNTYRFAIEWARIEPQEGFFSRADIRRARGGLRQLRLLAPGCGREDGRRPGRRAPPRFGRDEVGARQVSGGGHDRDVRRPGRRARQRARPEAGTDLRAVAGGGGEE